jgi:hypothetical protein
MTPEAHEYLLARMQVEAHRAILPFFVGALEGQILRLPAAERPAAVSMLSMCFDGLRTRFADLTIPNVSAAESMLMTDTFHAALQEIADGVLRELERKVAAADARPSLPLPR